MSISNRARPLPGRLEGDLGSLATHRTFGQVLKENGLSIVTFGFFFLFLFGQSMAGWLEYNSEAREHGQVVLGYFAYLLSSHFFEATFENWESEFLQMAAFVLLTSCLYQKGSAESNKMDEENPQGEDPRKHRDNPDAPGPVRKGGLALRLYERSLSAVLALCFLLSFAGHAIAGAKEYSQDQVAHGEQAVSTFQYMATARFWFESLQNWQSEFLAVFSLVVLSIWLRDRGSPESKPVHAAHGETGD